MSKHSLIVLFVLCCELFVGAANIKERKQIEYPLIDATIDVVIVSHPKDKPTLDLCIEGIRSNCSKIGRVIVVSSKPLTKNAEWFNEADFPFSKKDIELQIGRGDSKKAAAFFEESQPVGWYYQQLLKLYAPFVIPDISPNVLVIDADTIFLNPVEFLNSSFGGLFCTSDMPAKQNYLNHAKRLVPGYKRIYPKHYSVCHHMLFQKPILDDLFNTVEQFHKKSFWKAFCRCVDLEENGASEYEIYYNFALRRTSQVELRPLKWKNSPYLDKISTDKKHGYQFVSYHTYMRRKA